MSKITKSERHSQGRDAWKRLRRNKLAMVGMLIVILMVFAALFADFVAPYDYAQQDLANKFADPTLAHPCGTDNYGRDILTRIIYGGRTSLLVCILSLAISLVIGGILGMISGYYAGVTDGVIMRIIDVIQAIPAFLLAICISAALGTGIGKTALALAVGFVPGYARLIRAQVMSIHDQEYVEAARLSGCSPWRVMLRHILPNILSPIIVDTTLRVGAAIMTISSLSFIGLGVQPPTPEWGSMLADGREYIRDYWPMVVWPGVAIMASLFGFNLFGDGLRDALDPRLKR